ncbi:MAG: purine-binding chemotaxis protein CheW [Nitrospirae bacterium]|nr:purine-binding chemotaxis protein CheW [Nitrospirota bacterium]
MSKYTIFNIGGDIFGIDISRVLEILRVQKIFSIPGLPGFLTGVMSVRGAVIPVMDLRLRFGMKPSGKKERIILVRYGEEKIGFLVDEIREILRLNPEDLRPSPSIFKGFKTEYLTGLGKKGDQIIILLNIDNLLTSEEKIWLKESKELLEDNGAGTGKTAQ